MPRLRPSCNHPSIVGVEGTQSFIGAIRTFSWLARSALRLGGYTARMSAQIGPASPVEPPERTPAAIRAELPEELRGQFDAEYQAALEEARASYRLDRLNEVIQAWWQLVWARRSPRHEQAVQTGRRLLRGEAVETFPVDLDALRP
jgi:hypothetical protein